MQPQIPELGYDLQNFTFCTRGFKGLRTRLKFIKHFIRVKNFQIKSNYAFTYNIKTIFDLIFKIFEKLRIIFSFTISFLSIHLLSVNT